MKKDFNLELAKEIIESLHSTGFSKVENETESINLVNRHISRFNFKTDRRLEVELLQNFDKDYILDNMESLLKILCTNEDFQEYNLTNEIYLIWELKDQLKEHLAK